MNFCSLQFPSFLIDGSLQKKAEADTFKAKKKKTKKVSFSFLFSTLLLSGHPDLFYLKNNRNILKSPGIQWQWRTIEDFFFFIFERVAVVFFLMAGQE